MDRLVDHLFVFEGDGVVRDFPGNYSQYRIEERSREKIKESPVVDTPSPVSTDQVAAAAPAKRKLSFKEKREFEQLEKDMPALEAEKIAVTERMAVPGLAYDEIQKLSVHITEITAALEEKEMRWLELSEFME
jgi:ATP-binding cassette subfamily F protein uup